MTAPGARRLVIGRLRKPHGLKGEFTVFPLTSTPETVFAPGSRLMRVDLGGEPLGELEIGGIVHGEPVRLGEGKRRIPAASVARLVAGDCEGGKAGE